MPIEVRVDEALYAYLSGQVSITSLVGTRIYPVRLPQGAALPALTYQRISGVRDYVQGGQSLAHARYQLDCWGKTTVDSRNLAEQVRLVLGGYQGMMGGGSGVRVTSVFLQNDLDSFDPDPQLYRVLMDFMISYAEA